MFVFPDDIIVRSLQTEEYNNTIYYVYIVYSLLIIMSLKIILFVKYYVLKQRTGIPAASNL